MAGFGCSAPSQAIPHDGETPLCGSCGGVSFSWFHRANSNPTRDGGFSKQIQDRTQVRYEWLPDGLVSGTSRQFFNRGSGDVGTFLWGYTAGHAAPDSTTVCLEGTSQSCNMFIDALYGVNSVGIDLLYTGSFSPFAEPGAYGLLAIGVVGLADTRRRRNA